MSTRTLATAAARQAAHEMRALLAGDVTRRAHQLIAVLDRLADPRVWDGPEASAFRQSTAPQQRTSLIRAVQSLQSLQQHADRVLTDILRAGGDGTLGGGGAPNVTGGAPVHSGTVTPMTTADSGGGPDQKTKDMLAYFRQHVNDQGFFGDRSTLESLDQRLARLTPAERAAFLSQLSPAELQNWDSRISGADMAAGQPGLPNAERVQLANMLFGSADPATLATVEANMPSLEPALRNQDSGLTYRSTSGQPLFDTTTNGPVVPTADPGHNQPTDVRQGELNDCWFLSGLGSVARQNPGLIEQNIKQNPNGTYTVTLYQNGHPVPVTVTDDLPTDSSGNAPFAQAGSESDSPKWAQLYEKAYAQLQGGYGAIDHSSDGDEAMTAITGYPSQTLNVDSNLSLADMQAKLSSGQAITAATDHVWWPWQGNREDNGNLVGDHIYMVQSIDTSSKPPTITVVNPWGNNAGAPQSVKMTEAEFRQNFTDVCETPTRVPGQDPVVRPTNPM